MNIKRLGVPVYENDKGQKYVLQADLKLALDSDMYNRIMDRAVKIVADNGRHGIDLNWLELQY